MIDLGLSGRDTEIVLCMIARLRKKGLIKDDADSLHFDAIELNAIYTEDIGISDLKRIIAALDRLNRHNPDSGDLDKHNPDSGQ